MFYSFIRVVARIILLIVNGRPKITHKDRLPEGTYILVGPHRTWFDPIYYALAASPRKFSFMTKKELFKNPIIRFVLNHANAYPVDRDHPGPSAIKTPVKILKQGELSTIIFPSGTRHSSEMKGGATVIAKLAGVPLVPTVYQGPLTFMGLFSRKRVKVSFGEPIYIDRKFKTDDAGQQQIDQQMQTAFDALDKEIDPSFHYVDPNQKLYEEYQQKQAAEKTEEKVEAEHLAELTKPEVHNSRKS
ncbi:lysophospholipid acyltransferase family protein [Furfurilactobacillus rossiae]|uniref:1-acyl-sn-glycerol-3-phosphate acyltransferase n=1 Tax=Furfurilactobacillus rossiae DSM 15814 TaxID=1114972 RepID=A0A0R1RJM2_9LACO|nr:1-acyl-sn-glycerol-3-phosphate acyltransferase [Furfurilactobacillus rossiae]KRL57103.1 1-acyl-sn-glycerol-3-phosphate acyltransferase [Furfurilactobacillus rossiae DSM 15814]MCF6165487.1 1-acyl-sn-glycerol-3-phosphate acyltransferase [Furfurilactobacillus rossiae]QFR66006.1 1-acyl-sn-glycerol-3-phosphate acyltransferase [Furfurilactobacillus rossiae]QLE61426.1 1-acyl-sn-glycerol-3-phosphate acyltransferase [Furfurilactobacillus rossiae]QLE64224.1 1-acyl-sn-glycerol-3-phosphate acyltransfer